MVKEYKVVKYRENILKAILFGQARVSPRAFTRFLNRHSREGWSAITIDRSVEGVFLLFSRENYVVVLERDKTLNSHNSHSQKPKPKPKPKPAIIESEI